MSMVSVVKCTSYDPDVVSSAVRRAVDLLGGIAEIVKPGQKVLLKPNLLSAHLPEKRVTTDPAVVEAVGAMVKEAGGRLAIADSPALDSFGRVAAKTGMAAVARKLGAELVELSRPVRVAPPSGARFKNLEIAAQITEAEVVINLPKLKTHCQALLTLGVKNLFGTVVAQRKAEWHHMVGGDREAFAALLLDLYLAVHPALTILDGVWGMEGHGPTNGQPRRFDLLAASKDALALDLGLCGLMGVPPRRFPLYRAATARGLASPDLTEITCLGDPRADFPFKGMLLPELDAMEFLPPFLGGFTQRYLVSKPVQDEKACAGCGQCVRVCPAGCITLATKRLKFDYERCIRCYCCQEVCEQDAIHFKKGLLLRALNRLGR